MSEKQHGEMKKAQRDEGKSRIRWRKAKKRFGGNKWLRKVTKVGVATALKKIRLIHFQLLKQTPYDKDNVCGCISVWLCMCVLFYCRQIAQVICFVVEVKKQFHWITTTIISLLHVYVSMCKWNALITQYKCKCSCNCSWETAYSRY